MGEWVKILDLGQKFYNYLSLNFVLPVFYKNTFFQNIFNPYLN